MESKPNQADRPCSPIDVNWVDFYLWEMPDNNQVDRNWINQLFFDTWCVGFEALVGVQGNSLWGSLCFPPKLYTQVRDIRNLGI